jgi:myo-inositol-1(or 4)-monophosphatase
MPTELLQTAIEAARAAGDTLRELRNKPRQITEKGRLDIFTDADLAADAAIQEVIQRKHPTHVILSEESDAGKNIASWQPPDVIYWIIDPIDGTANFARGLPSWSISIAVAQGEQLLAGVVYDVARDDLFAAAYGTGTTLNDMPVYTNKSTSLEWALCGVDWPTPPEHRHQMLDYANRLGPHVRSIRCWGTSALALAHVAAGFLDSYLHLTLKPWDCAAGALLVLEAGGTLTNASGGLWSLRNPDIFATAGPLHEPLLGLIHESEGQNG